MIVFMSHKRSKLSPNCIKVEETSLLKKVNKLFLINFFKGYMLLCMYLLESM